LNSGLLRLPEFEFLIVYNSVLKIVGQFFVSIGCGCDFGYDPFPFIFIDK
jgi:hypothetical protein